MDASTQECLNSLIAARKASGVAYKEWQAADGPAFVVALEAYKAACRAECAAEKAWDQIKQG